MKTPSIKQLAAANAATAVAAPVAAHVSAAHQAVEALETVRLNFDVPKELHVAVKMKAVADGKTMKEVMLAFLRDYTRQ